MCGVNLVLHYPEDQAGKAISKMMEATQHRGPDSSHFMRIGTGTYLSGNRLKILDLSDRCNQPLLTADEKGILVWNGALYNYQDLRNELLSLGISFASQSDSEVLLYWLYTFGKKGMARLSGMYSFIFINRNSNSILIARDPLGQKPLYFHQDGNKWLFSSEFRGIFASGLVGKSWNTSQYHPYFYFRHTAPRETFHGGIQQVLPGEALELNFEGEMLEKQMLDVPSKPISLPQIDRFEELIVDAVLKHFHADVPVGMILSGGADSALLYQVWFRETGIPLHSYTAVFEKKYQNKFQDFRYAKRLAKNCHGKHREILVKSEDFRRHWPAYLETLDHPVGDTAGFLTWMISREASPEVKVLIGGAGADELFGGYNRHKAFLLYLKYYKIAGYLKKTLSPLPVFPRMFQKLIKGIGASNMETYLNFAALQSVPPGLFADFNKWFVPENNPYKAALNWDRDVYLIHDILKVFDNATMAHGIEGRSPYLDMPLVNLSMSMTEQQHKSLGPKQWIKELLVQYGSAEIANRKKLGFGLPVGEWLRDDARFRKEVFSMLRQFESEFGGDFPVEMRKLAQKPEAGIRQSFLQLWNMYLLASWKYTHNL
ncbi:asparagine synthase (glutamine-hydrolyzing) [Lunatibacter salilacus]|uniref:asparagine synthase (glutamine-hydrolyzing) n=1 Tax=Lunatibacter salilacus TaxID=2483804 RepID=UPI00131BDC23|nr:asparagine synthase (glutamine-hydrolyzing) [Lunatibacter salilacus]